MAINKEKMQVDIVNEILEECIIAYPVSSYIISIYKQYGQRGFLSKKQLEGLYDKAAKIEGIIPGKLATLEALIKKMPTRYKSTLPVVTPLFEKDETAAKIIDLILAKYPQHKRVLFLKAKYDNNEIISSAEIDELKKFQKILL